MARSPTPRLTSFDISLSADRIVVLRDGRVQHVADPGELYGIPRNAFVAGFIGTPPMNLIKGTVEPGMPPFFRSRDGLSLLPLPGLPADSLTAPAGRPLVLGVRPEDVHPATDGGLAVRVDLVEPLGNEILVDASLGETELIERAAPGQAPSAASSVRMQADTARPHFFDARAEHGSSCEATRGGESLNLKGNHGTNVRQPGISTAFPELNAP